MEHTLRSAIQSMSGINDMFHDASTMAGFAFAGEVGFMFGAGASLTKEFARNAAETTAPFIRDAAGNLYRDAAGRLYATTPMGRVFREGHVPFQRVMDSAAAARQEGALVIGAETAEDSATLLTANKTIQAVAANATDFPIALNYAEAVSEKEIEMGRGMSEHTFETISDLQEQLARMLDTQEKCCKNGK